MREIIQRRRDALGPNEFVEMVARRVPKDKYCPEGIKYSFVYVRNGTRLVGIDNYNRERNHFHYLEKKKSYKFKSLEDTTIRFFKMVKKLWEEEK